MLVRTLADLGGALRQARTSADMTQAELAEWLGVSRDYVRSLEAGGATERIERLMTALGLLGLELHVVPRGQISAGPLGSTPPDPGDSQ